MPISVAAGPNAVWVVRRRVDGQPELVRLDPRFYVVGPGRLVQGDSDGAAGVSVGRDGVWVAAVRGVLSGTDSKDVQRAVVGINQAFVQSPYITR